MDVARLDDELFLPGSLLKSLYRLAEFAEDAVGALLSDLVTEVGTNVVLTGDAKGSAGCENAGLRGASGSIRYLSIEFILSSLAFEDPAKGLICVELEGRVRERVGLDDDRSSLAMRQESGGTSQDRIQ